MASTVEVTFLVDVETSCDQYVRLVGDDDCLGAWDAREAVTMERKISTNSLNLWTCSLSLKKNRQYKYRYFLCPENQRSPCEDRSGTVAFPSIDVNSKSLTVDKWETNVEPREFNTDDGDRLELPVDTFGHYGGLTNVGKGWLINQCEIQIRLHNNPIHMWKAKHQSQSYSIKCLAMDYAATEGMTVNVDDDSRDGPPPCSVANVLVSALTEENCQPVPQGHWGQEYKQDDYLVFRTQIPDLHNVGFQLDFFVYEENEAAKFVGSCHILPLNFAETKRIRRLPIIGCKHQPIGKVTVDLLVARPVQGVNFSMESTYQTQRQYKELGTKSLDIGHRGMGISYTQFNMLKENTVASFASAASHGADFVEFDVLLSKDMRPVIYHDYSVHVSYTTNKKNHRVETELFEIPVKCLTLSQLQSMRLYSSEKVELNDDYDDILNTQPFPTLERCLTEVDENMGFNIEIKYPQQDENDKWEAENYIDLNENLDHILKVIHDHAGKRKIILSCFDPDTVVLLQLKQNKYPVMFLNQGPTKRWVPYKDNRAKQFKSGIKFARSEQMLGVVLLSESVLTDLSIIEFAKKEDMVVFVWGDENNDPHVIRMLRDLQVDGIIYDRIDRHKPEHHPEFQLSSAKDEAIFKAIVNTAESGASVQVTVE